MKNELIKILYVDDEKAALFNFEQLFNDDFEVFTANSADKGMEILATTDIQIIISDQRMPHKSGIEFLADVSQSYPDTIRILLTAFSEAADIIAAINQGQVYQYITKPFETRNVKNILDKASLHWRLTNENRELIVQLQNKITEQKKAEQDLLTTQAELKKSLEVSNQSRKTLLNVLEDQQDAQQKINQLNAELEQRVKTRTAQLEAANKELETFTYSVSHDLKAPLRGIDGYSKLLIELYGNSLNDEAKLFLTTIRNSTLQMNQLIEDLLEYSRLERSILSREKIKIGELIRLIATNYKNELAAGNCKLTIDVQDIEIIADNKGLTIALRNIIENAIKFTSRKTDPVIEISFEDEDTCWIIRIGDNGIGFDMKYHQRIFEIFQRLQRAEDFHGTGVGLAMVAKAMHRMGGKAWAESTPGIGSTFYLEIPK
jgi:signal transduction histidine kinase